MYFENLSAAQGYVRQMDEQATANIGDQTVYQYSDGEVVIADTDEQIDDADDAQPVGTVAEVLY